MAKDAERICDVVGHGIGRLALQGLTIQSLAYYMRQHSAKVRTMYGPTDNQDARWLTFIFVDNSYIKIGFTGTSKVLYELGVEYRVPGTASKGEH